MLLLPGYQFPLLRIGGLLTTRSLAAFPEDDAHTVAVAQKVFFSAQETVTWTFRGKNPWARPSGKGPFT